MINIWFDNVSGKLYTWKTNLYSKTLNKIGIEQMYLKYDKPTAHTALRNENLKTFTLRSEIAKMPSLTTFNKVLNAKPEQLDETKK